MIGSEVNPAKREEYVQRLMEPPNARGPDHGAGQGPGRRVPQAAGGDRTSRTSSRPTRSCTSLGQPFQNQMSNIYADVLNVYSCTPSSSARPSRRGAVRVQDEPREGDATVKREVLA